MTLWVTAADAKRVGRKHRAGHMRLGRDYTACGHKIGHVLGPDEAAGIPECQACVGALVVENENQGPEPRTLRDDFAMAAMDKVSWILGDLDSGAKVAYEIADAMMKARQEKA